MQFKDIPGHRQIKQKLIASVTSDKVAQAIMLLGPEGNGGLPLALAYATYLNCTDRQEQDSCGICGSCNKSRKYIHPDIHYTYPVVTRKSGKPSLSTDYIQEWRQAITETPYMNGYQWLDFINAENKQGNITVDECKDIIRNQTLKAYEASYKVQIIWLAEHLKQAGNILLKIIEEPPPRTVFILVVEHQEQILNTILSRTQVVRLGKFDDESIRDYLMTHCDLSAEESEQISRVSNGNMHAALLLAEQEETINSDFLLKWFTLIRRMARSQDLDLVSELAAMKDEFQQLKRENQKIFLKYMLFFIREVLMISVGHTSKLKAHEKSLAQDLAEILSMDQIEQWSQQLNQMHYYIERNANPRILFFNSTLKLARVMGMRELVV